MRTSSSAVIAALRRAPSSILKRHKAYLQQLEVEAGEAPFDLNVNAHKIGDKYKHTARALLPNALSFDKAAKTLLHDVKFGEINHATWSQSKKLVIQACGYKKAELATQLLNRLTKECLSSPHRLDMNETLFNIVIHAWAEEKKPEQAENVFAQMLHSHAQDSARVPPPNNYTYNTLLAAWAGSGSPIAVDRVLEILEEMELSQDNQPDKYTYNTVMTCYANLVGKYGAAKAAEDVLLRFSERHVQGIMDEGPQTMSFNIIIKAWSNCGDEKGPDRAHQIFRLMEKLHDEGHADLKPDVSSVVSLMNAYALKGDLKMVEKLLQTANVDGDPTNYMNCAMSAYAKSGLPDAGDRAEEIMAQMKNADGTSCKIVMQAHASANRPDAANRCEDFLGRAVENYLRYKSDIRPTKALFHSALRSWYEHHNKKEAAERASALVEDMIGLNKEWKLQTKPDERTYSFLIGMWARVNADKAYEILGEAEKQGMFAWKESYNDVIEGFTRNDKISVGSMEKIFELQQRLESRGIARIYTYNLVLYALSKQKSSIAKEQSLKILNMVEDAFQNGDKEKRPNLRTYTTVLNTFSHHPKRRDTATAIDIFHRMVQLENDPKIQCQLDLSGYNAVLLLLSRTQHGKAADAATEIFDRMLRPESNTYPNSSHQTAAILANTNARTSRHTLSAYHILLKTSRLFLNGKLKHHPLPGAFTEVLRALSLSRNIDSVTKGYEILDLTKKLKVESLPSFIAFFAILSNGVAKDINNSNGVDAEKILRTIPSRDTNLWNSVLQVWGYSRHANKVCEIQRCLREMQEANIKPNTASYNTVLSAAANIQVRSPEHMENAMKVALETFEELNHSENAQPDHFSYGIMINCYRSLMPPSRERASCIRDIFEQCKEKGEVGSICLRELHAALPPEDFEECTGINAGTDARKKDFKSEIRSLPVAWNINIRRRQRQR